jgi:hypothetical protein
MNHTACHETQCRQAVHKSIASLHSKRYWLSGMLIHRPNLYVPRGKQCTSLHEALSHELVNKVKKLSVLLACSYQAALNTSK